MAKNVKRGFWGGSYFVTYIGAAVFFLNHTHGFWGQVWGLLEALVWPAFFVYHALALLHVTSLG